MEAQVAELISLEGEACAAGAALGREWLECDGSGAYASSTILFANTRRYHGLLVAPVKGLGRHVFLSWCEERVEDWLEEWSADWYVDRAEDAAERGFYASCALFAGGGLWPAPLARFERGLIACAHYAVQGLSLTKEVFLLRGRRSVAIRYVASGPCRLSIKPFFACRPFHALTQWNSVADLSPRREGPWQVVRPYPELPPVYLTASGRRMSDDPGWYYRFHYPEEAARGFEAEEDLFCPGPVRLELAAGEPGWLVAGLERVSPEEAEAAWREELDRRAALVRGREPLAAQLALAADQFLVAGPEEPSVVAGYPWFEEVWGRDLLVSVPGLLLVDGRLGEAAAVLSAFAGHLEGGLLPNRLPLTGPPEYNSADASLFFLLACQRLAEAAGGLETLRPLWPAVSAVIESWRRGTAHGVGVAAGGLPTQNDPGLALTWMDASLKGRPVTPRSGHAVELCALWYNGLLFAAGLAEEVGRGDHAAAWRREAARAQAAFEAVFWDEERGCCYDAVSQEGVRDPALRPNQLFAVGLPHPLLTGRRAAGLLEVVERELLTPFGPRSLARGEPGYVARYGGPQAERDCAYHQGPVWPWLWGVYADAWLKVNGPGRRSELRERIAGPLAGHLTEAGVGSVSELFDAEEPHAPGGCPAQAWSVAELRRALALLE